MIGQLLNNGYKILSLLGEGGMGEVYLATDQQTGQRLAVKVLAIHLRANSEMLQRFQREAKTLRQLEHPNIVKFVDAFEHEGQFVIVMEYVPGGSLHDLLKNGPLPIDRARKIALGLCDALIRAHQLNIIHRDIKPENVLLAEDGTPKLTDFGVARLSEGTRMTRSGTQVGTPYYMSPEAWEGKSLDAQADIWSLGVILFEMLAGQVPFGGETPVAVMTRVHTSSLPELRKLRPDVPINLIKITRRMVARDKGKRYQTMREVAVDLEREQTVTSRKSLPKTPTIANSEKRLPWNSRLVRMMITGSAITVTATIAILYSTDRLSYNSSVTATPLFTSTPAVEEVESVSPEATLSPTSTRGPTETPTPTATPIFIEANVLLEEDFEERDLGRIFGWNFGSYILHVANPGQYWNVEDEENGNRILFGNVVETDETGFFLGSAAWTDYSLEFRARGLSRDNGEQIFGIRVRDSTDQGCPLGYELGFGRWWFVVLSSGPRLASGECQFRHLVDAKQINIELDRWYVFRVELFESSVTLYADGELIHKVSNDRSLNGGVEFAICCGGQITFDDIRVVELTAR